MSESGEKIILLFKRGEAMIFFLSSKYHWADVVWLWQTKMYVESPLNFEIVVSMDVWISKIWSGNKFRILVLLFTRLFSRKSWKTLPRVATSFRSPGRIGLILKGWLDVLKIMYVYFRDKTFMTKRYHGFFFFEWPWK